MAHYQPINEELALSLINNVHDCLLQAFEPEKTKDEVFVALEISLIGLANFAETLTGGKKDVLLVERQSLGAWAVYFASNIGHAISVFQNKKQLFSMLEPHIMELERVVEQLRNNTSVAPSPLFLQLEILQDFFAGRGEREEQLSTLLKTVAPAWERQCDLQTKLIEAEQENIAHAHTRELSVIEQDLVRLRAVVVQVLSENHQNVTKSAPVDVLIERIRQAFSTSMTESTVSIGKSEPFVTPSAVEIDETIEEPREKAEDRTVSLNLLNSNTLVVEKEEEFRARIEELEALLSERNATIGELEHTIKEKDLDIERLEAEKKDMEMFRDESDTEFVEAAEELRAENATLKDNKLQLEQKIQGMEIDMEELKGAADSLDRINELEKELYECTEQLTKIDKALECTIARNRIPMINNLHEEIGDLKRQNFHLISGSRQKSCFCC
ncbi:hypothetical protein PCE1_002390 [Barthelona sp. PCE]